MSQRKCLWMLPAALTALLSGCGYIGEPLPPLLHIPARVGDLSAVQRGATILVHFTPPNITTEGTVLKQPAHEELRIGPKQAGAFNVEAWAAGAKPIPEGILENGVDYYRIAAAEWTGKEVLIAVRAIGANGRDAGWSTPVTLSVVSPPEQPLEVHAEAAPQGVRLTWHASGNAFAVFRRGPEEKEYTLLARSDRPEWADNTAEFGKTYTYVVQSVVKAGEGEAQSELSREVQITPADTFPPASPAGLTAVPSTASIELVWERSTDPTVTAYRVYRALGEGPFERLTDNQELPGYSDRKIESGKVYRYAVSAVKRNGIESQKSAPVEASAP